MTGLFLLDWLALAFSLFNAGLMLWLGLTVVLNAERRGREAWGTYLIAGSLVLGSFFFISHSALLSLDVNTVSRGVNFWWRVGWWPVLALPAAWYVVVLWYAGYWDDRQTALHRRQRPWLWVCALALAALVGLVLFANPLPSLGAFAQPDPARTLAIGGVPLLIVTYPAYILLCVTLTLDALLRPGPSRRVLGQVARSRARPWLAVASLVLLLVSVLVAWVMLLLTRRLSGLHGAAQALPADELLTIAWFDLVIAGLIALAVVLLGQALVAYEIFTGKSLPRRGLLRYWRSALLLAGGYGLLAGWSLALQLRPIYSVLLSSALLSIFYALFSWRAYVERERYMCQLRPFVTSQRLYDHLLENAPAVSGAAGADSATFAQQSFRALCRDVLGTRLAYLAALGPSAPLVGQPLIYGADAQPSPGWLEARLAEVAARNAPAASPQALLPLESPEGGVLWALPLWSERGLIGVLLLGDKSDGGLYAQEEIEIARAGAERLIDSLASAELARRLLALQRQRLAESQVLDRRARRVLHDDVLPQLHAALLHLNDPGQPQAEAVSLLAGAHKQLADLLRDMPNIPAPEIARLGLVPALRQLVAGEFAHAFDEVTWQVDPEAERSGAGLAPLAAEIVFYAAREAMRNAARYGRRDGAGPLLLRLALGMRAAPERGAPAGLWLVVEDNGPGLNGAGPQPTVGTGLGLALHSTLLAVLGGSLTVESSQGVYTRVTLHLPQDSLKIKGD